jgi:hypothetical protein
MIDNLIRRDDKLVHRDKAVEVASPVEHVGISAADLSANNYEEFEDKIDRRKVGPEFTQQNWLKGQFHQCEIYRQHYIFQTIKRHRDKVCLNYRVNLAWLNPKPEVVQKIAWKWASTALATAMWSLVLFYVAYFSGMHIDHIESAAILMSTITVISLCMFFYRSENKLVFNSYLSSVPLVELDYQKPDQASFDAFVTDIRNGIYAGWQDKDIQQMLTGEIRELRRLRDAGIINEKIYLKARTTIFNHREYQVITHRNLAGIVDSPESLEDI